MSQTMLGERSHTRLCSVQFVSLKFKNRKVKSMTLEVRIMQPSMVESTCSSSYCLEAEVEGLFDPSSSELAIEEEEGWGRRGGSRRPLC